MSRVGLMSALALMYTPMSMPLRSPRLPGIDDSLIQSMGGGLVSTSHMCNARGRVGSTAAAKQKRKAKNKAKRKGRK